MWHTTHVSHKMWKQTGTFWKEKGVRAMQIAVAGQKQHIKKVLLNCLLILKSLPTFLLSVGLTLTSRHQPLFYAPGIPSILCSHLRILVWSNGLYHIIVFFQHRSSYLLGLHLASRIFSIPLYNETIIRNYALKHTLSSEYTTSYCWRTKDLHN